MGLPKALLPAGPNHTLLSRVVALALGAVDGATFVVVGSEPEMMHVEIARCGAMAGVGGRPRVKTIVNAAYAQGQSTSLVAAIRRVRAEGALLLLVDQPALRLDEVTSLVRTWRGRAPNTLAVATASDGRQRTPVILGAKLFPKLLDLEGDQGARRVLRAHTSQVQLVEWAAGMWQIDVDTWEDYVQLARALAWDRECDKEVRDLLHEWAAISAHEIEPARRLAALRRGALAALQS